MNERFTFALPGQRYTRIASSGDKAQHSEFSLRARPSEPVPEPYEFLPTDSQVLPPFEPSSGRDKRFTVRKARHVEAEVLAGETAQVAYLPGGEVGDHGVHLACRVTLVADPDPMVDGVNDGTSDDIASHHKEQVWEAFKGDPNRPIYTDWVTTDTVDTTAHGYDRTVHWYRRPVLEHRDLPTSVQRPVEAYAFVVQSTEWGLVETCAYLTPKPEEERARTLATTLADTVMQQVRAYPRPGWQVRDEDRAESPGGSE